jgi:hypothetical protein
MQHKGGNLWIVLFHFTLNVCISVMILNGTRNSTFVQTELLIDGPEEYNQPEIAFICIY